MLFISQMASAHLLAQVGRDLSVDAGAVQHSRVAAVDPELRQAIVVERDHVLAVNVLDEYVRLNIRVVRLVVHSTRLGLEPMDDSRTFLISARSHPSAVASFSHFWCRKSSQCSVTTSERLAQAFRFHRIFTMLGDQELDLGRQTLLQCSGCDSRRIQRPDRFEGPRKRLTVDSRRLQDLVVGRSEKTILVEIAEDELAHRHHCRRAAA